METMKEKNTVQQAKHWKVFKYLKAKQMEWAGYGV